MKALYLAGGMGTRLRPLTERVPKPMVPLLARPLLERGFERLKAHGVDEVVLSTCYKSECFEEYFGGGAKFGLQIRHVVEEMPLGTGGAIKNAEKHFGEPFFVFNADIVSDVDFSKMLRFHQRKKADVTIAVARVEDPSAYGMVVFDGDDYAVTFKEKPKPHEVTSNYINAGIYVFEPDVLKMIPAGREVSVEREVFPKLLEKGGRIAVFKGCGYWLDLGTPEKYRQIHMDIFAGLFSIPGVDFSGGAEGLDDARVHPDAVLRGPVYLGRGVRIEAGATVGPNVVIGDNSVVGKRSAVADSILWSGVEIGRNCEMRDCIVTDGCFIESGARLDGLIVTESVKKRLAAS